MITISENITRISVGMVAMGADNESVDFVGRTAEMETVTVSLTRDELQSAFELLRDM